MASLPRPHIQGPALPIVNVGPNTSDVSFISPITTIFSVSPAISANLTVTSSAAPKGYKRNGMPRLRTRGCCSICRAPDHVKTKCLLYNGSTINVTPKRKHQRHKVQEVDMTDNTYIDPFATEEDIPDPPKKKYTKKGKRICRSDVNNSNDSAVTPTLASRAPEKKKANDTNDTKDYQKTSDLESATLPKMGFFSTRLPMPKWWKAPTAADPDATRCMSQEYPKAFDIQNVGSALATDTDITFCGHHKNDTGPSVLPPDAQQPSSEQHTDGNSPQFYYQRPHLSSSEWSRLNYTEASLTQQQTLSLPQPDSVVSEFYKE